MSQIRTQNLDFAVQSFSHSTIKAPSEIAVLNSCLIK